MVKKNDPVSRYQTLQNDRLRLQQIQKMVRSPKNEKPKKSTRVKQTPEYIIVENVPSILNIPKPNELATASLT